MPALHSCNRPYPGAFFVVLISFAAPLLFAQQPPQEQPGKDSPAPVSQAPVESAPPQPGPTPEPDPAKKIPADSKPAPDETQKQPALLAAKVIEVSGKVEWALAGVSPLIDDGWTPLKPGDELQPTTQIRTGLRSHVNLQFGQTTTISIRSITHASIEQFYRSATSENVKINVGYGCVRGGSSEGTIKSDVIVDSPVATLAKRGTEGWEIQVEPGQGRFRIALAEHGLVEAIQKLAGDRTRARLVRPGEYATHANIANMWIKQDIFNRVVAFYEPDSMTEADSEFAAENSRGLSVLAPGGGSALIDLSGRVSAEFVLAQTGSGASHGFLRPDIAVGLRTPAAPEGNFGTPRTFRAIRAK